MNSSKMDEAHLTLHQEATPSVPVLGHPPPQRSNLGMFPVSSSFPMTLAPVVLPITAENSVESLALDSGNQVKKPIAKPIRPIPLHPLLPPPSSKMADLNLNKSTLEPLPLSLKLSTPSSLSSDEQSPSASPPQQLTSPFQAMSNGDSIISVA